MIVNLAYPVSDKLRPIVSVIVRVPPPSVDLYRPPRGVNKFVWRIAQITGLHSEAAALINIDDAEAIVDAYEVVATRFCETARVIAEASRSMHTSQRPTLNSTARISTEA